MRAIASLPSLSPISVRFGPRVLPFSPILWQPRQPEVAATALPFSMPGRCLELDLGRRAGERPEHRQVGHREDRRDRRHHRDRALERVALGAAVDERQQQQQDQADRGNADRRQHHELRRLDHAQQLEEEEEVPLGPRRVGGGGRVGLGPELGAEDDRHRDDHEQHDRRPSRRPSRPRRGRTASPGSSGCGTRGGTALSRACSQRSDPQISSCSSSFLCALSHGGAVVPSFATR